MPHIKKYVKGCEMACWVKVPVAKPDSLGLRPRAALWRERADTASCHLASRTGHAPLPGEINKRF